MGVGKNLAPILYLISMTMLSINYCIEKKLPTDYTLTTEDKQAILKENEGKCVSYLALMKEMFNYKHTTVGDLLLGWGGVKIVKVN